MFMLRYQKCLLLTNHTNFVRGQLSSSENEQNPYVHVQYDTDSNDTLLNKLNRLDQVNSNSYLFTKKQKNDIRLLFFPKLHNDTEVRIASKVSL